MGRKKPAFWVWCATFPWLKFYDELLDEDFRCGQIDSMRTQDALLQLEMVAWLTQIRSIVFGAIVILVTEAPRQILGTPVNYYLTFSIALWLPCLTSVLGLIHILWRRRRREPMIGEGLWWALRWSPLIAALVCLPLGFFFGAVAS